MTTLYDQFGRKISPREVRRPDTREISVATIRDRWSTYPSKGLTPTRLADIFRAADNGDVARQAEMFEEMEEKDAHLASQFQTRKLAVQGLDWEVLPTEEGRAAKRAARLSEENLNGLDLDECVLDMLDALSKGYSMIEIMWDSSAGEVAIRDFKWIHPKKVTFWNSMIPRILTDDEPVKGVDPPAFKTVYHSYKARSGYDTRAGIMRVCAWMYLFKNYGIKDWVAFAEVYGMPLRVGKYDVGASEGDKTALLNAVRSLGSDAAGIISKNTEIEFVEAQRSTTLNVYEALASFCDAQMSKAIVGQTATAEGTPGKLGSEKARADVRQDLIEADCSALARTIKRQILKPLVGFNLGWDAPVPDFRFLYEPPEDLEQISRVYKTVIVDMGFPASVEHVSERFKIPAAKEGETLLTPATSWGFATGSGRHALRGSGGHGPVSGAGLAAAGNVLLVAKDDFPVDEDWIEKYMQAIAPTLDGAKEGALAEIEAYLRGLKTAPTVDQFMARVQDILGESYRQIDERIVADTAADMYAWYRVKDKLPGVAETAFGGPDVRTARFLGELDHHYVSKFVTNPEAQSKVNALIEKMYHEQGTALFGRDPEAIAEFRNQLSQALGELQEWEVRRIVETSVQRARNWGHIAQLDEAAFEELRVYEPTRDCDFCKEMDGKVISVRTAVSSMRSQAGMTPDQFETFLKERPAKLDRIERTVEEGQLPPYHPHCHGRIGVVMQ